MGRSSELFMLHQQDILWREQEELARREAEFLASRGVPSETEKQPGNSAHNPIQPDHKTKQQ